MTTYSLPALDKATPIVNPADGRPSPAFQRWWQNVKIGVDSSAAGGASTGWQALSGSGSQASYAVYTSPSISASYTPSQVQAISDALARTDAHLKAVIDALFAAGVITT